MISLSHRQNRQHAVTWQKTIATMEPSHAPTLSRNDDTELWMANGCQSVSSHQWVCMEVVVSTVLQLHPQLLVAVLSRFLDPDLPDTTATIPTPSRAPGAPLDVWRCPPVQISLPNSGHTKNRPTHKNQREHGFHGDLLVTVHINQLEFHFRRNPEIQRGAPVAVRSPSQGYTKFRFARPRTKNAMLLDCSRI